MRVATKGVPLADPPISTVDVQLGLLITRYPRRSIYGLLLRCMRAGRPSCASSLYAPTVRRRDDVLTLTRHRGILLQVANIGAFPGKCQPGPQASAETCNSNLDDGRGPLADTAGTAAVDPVSAVPDRA